MKHPRQLVARTLRPVLILLVAVAQLAVPCAAQDGVRKVPPGREMHESKVLTDGLHDLWKLEVVSGEVVHCVVESDAFDPVLSLIGPGGVELARHDGKGTRSEIRTVLTAAGEAQFRVEGYEGRGGGRYTCQIWRYTTTEQAAEGSTRARYGAEQWRHVAIELEAGDILVPTLTGDGRVTSVIEFDRGQATPGVLGAYEAVRPGWYHVRIEGRKGKSFELRTTLARRLTHPERPAAEQESSAPHGLDHWCARMEAGQVYGFELTMPAAQLDLHVRERPQHGGGRKDQRHKAYSALTKIEKGGHRREWFLAHRTVDVEILLRNHSDSTAPYTLGFAPVTTTLEWGTARGADLELGGGDLYRLEAQPGQLLDLGLQSQAFDAAFDVFGPDGGRIASVDDVGPLHRDPKLEHLIEKAGTHFVLVRASGNGGSGAYDLGARSVSVTALPIGTPVARDLPHHGLQFLQLELGQGQEVWLSVKGQNVDVALQVLDPRGRLLGTWEGGGIGTDVLCAIGAEHGGQHTLRVLSRHGSGSCTVRALSP